MDQDRPPEYRRPSRAVDKSSGHINTILATPFYSQLLIRRVALSIEGRAAFAENQIATNIAMVGHGFAIRRGWT
jgi:hypothetical protein